MSTPARVVVDASAVVAALLPERHTDAARIALASAEELLAPDLLYYEVVSALTMRHRRGDISLAQAEEKRLEARDLPVMTVPATDLDAGAFALAVRLNHSAYDCFYLALAVQHQCALLTDDQALFRAAHENGLEKHVQLLA